MKTIAERIREGLDLRGMKQSDLVNATGIGKSSISTYLAGEYEPKQKNIYKIAHALHVSESWLMGYDVPMDPIDLTQTKPSLSEEVLEIARLYEQLDAGDRGEIRGTIKTMLRAEKYIKSEKQEA